jgi:hypothetical protein
LIIVEIPQPIDRAPQHRAAMARKRHSQRHVRSKKCAASRNKKVHSKSSTDMIRLDYASVNHFRAGGALQFSCGSPRTADTPRAGRRLRFAGGSEGRIFSRDSRSTRAFSKIAPAGPAMRTAGLAFEGNELVGTQDHVSGAAQWVAFDPSFSSC